MTKLPITSINTEGDAIFLLTKLAEKATSHENFIILADAAYITLEEAGLSDGLYYMDEDMVNDCWADFQMFVDENKGY